MSAVREPDGTGVTEAVSVLAKTALRSRSSGVARRRRQRMMGKPGALLLAALASSRLSSPADRPGTRKLLSLATWPAFPVARPLQPTRRNSAVFSPSRLLLVPRAT